MPGPILRSPCVCGRASSLQQLCKGHCPCPDGKANMRRAAGLGQALSPESQLFCAAATAPWKGIRREPATGARLVRPGVLKSCHMLESDAQDAPETKESRVSGAGARASVNSHM